MTKEKLALYITDPESYLNGDRDYSLTVYSTNIFGKDNAPENWIYLGEVTSPKPPSRQRLLDSAVAKLNKEDIKIIAEAELQRDGILARQQRLLALPQPGDINDEL